MHIKIKIALQTSLEPMILRKLEITSVINIPSFFLLQLFTSLLFQLWKLFEFLNSINRHLPQPTILNEYTTESFPSSFKPPQSTNSEGKQLMDLGFLANDQQKKYQISVSGFLQRHDSLYLCRKYVRFLCKYFKFQMRISFRKYEMLHIFQALL